MKLFSVLLILFFSATAFSVTYEDIKIVIEYDAGDTNLPYGADDHITRTADTHDAIGEIVSGDACYSALVNGVNFSYSYRGVRVNKADHLKDKEVYIHTNIGLKHGGKGMVDQFVADGTNNPCFHNGKTYYKYSAKVKSSGTFTETTYKVLVEEPVPIATECILGATSFGKRRKKTIPAVGLIGASSACFSAWASGVNFDFGYEAFKFKKVNRDCDRKLNIQINGALDHGRKGFLEEWNPAPTGVGTSPCLHEGKMYRKYEAKGLDPQ